MGPAVTIAPLEPLLPLEVEPDDDEPVDGCAAPEFRVAVGRGVIVGGGDVSVGERAACTVISTIAVFTASVLIALISRVGSLDSPVPHAVIKRTTVKTVPSNILFKFFCILPPFWCQIMSGCTRVPPYC